MLQSMGSQRVRHDINSATTKCFKKLSNFFFKKKEEYSSSTACSICYNLTQMRSQVVTYWIYFIHWFSQGANYISWICLEHVVTVVQFDSLQPHGLQPSWVLCLLGSTRVLEGVVISFSRGIFPIRGLSTHFLHWLVDSLPLNHLGSMLRTWAKE